jgi:hypothetical protein
MEGYTNDELKRIWKEAVVVLVKVVSQYYAGRTEETHETPQSG